MLVLGWWRAHACRNPVTCEGTLRDATETVRARRWASKMGGVGKITSANACGITLAPPAQGAGMATETLVANISGLAANAAGAGRHAHRTACCSGGLTSRIRAGSALAKKARMVAA